MIFHNQDQGRAFRQIQEQVEVFFGGIFACPGKHRAGIFNDDQPSFCQERNSERVCLQCLETQQITLQTRGVQISHTGITHTRLKACQNLFDPDAVIPPQEVQTGFTRFCH
jgi:hypothetical protein